MSKPRFSGENHAPMKSPLARAEREFIDNNWRKFPVWLEGYHLTLCTILWSLGVLLFGYLAGVRENPHWLWLSSLMLVLQWFTDSFDGQLGRMRDTGIPKWGYYMDHFLDFIFIGCLMAGYALMVGDSDRTWAILMIPVVTALWANTFLVFGVERQLRITELGMGPTEIRIIFILINTFIIVFGVERYAAILPALFFISLFGMIGVVYQAHKRIWALDMADKAARKEEKGE